MFASLRRATAAALTGALVVLGAASCDSSTAPRTGKISLLLTDAPGDVVTAVVTIEQIYLQGSDSDNGDRVILRNTPFTTDLLTLVDSTVLLLEDVTVPARRYGQLRFVISGAYIEVENEDASTTIYASTPTYAGLPVDAVVGGSLQMPSLAQSGLKVNLPNDAVVILADETVVLLVDFDVSQSFGRPAGSSGQWVMSPVLTATVPPTP
jgi:hypothetical protein